MKKKIVSALIIFALAFMSFAGADSVKKDDTSVSAAGDSKTLMVYMTGSDLTSGAVSDLAEIADANVRNGDNVIVYIGGAEEWPITLPEGKDVLAKWQDNDLTFIGGRDSTNMGSPQTLYDFISYSMSEYPADSYSLILWNHGGGPIFGCCYDVVHKDVLSLAEISEALKTAGFGANKKLDFIGFDACLMGSFETAYALKDYASYMIFSQETEPGYGWNYDFLNSYGNLQGAAVGKEIVDKYFEAGEEYIKIDPRLTFDLTLSCVDLSKISELETAVDELFSVVDADVLNGLYPRVARCRGQAKVFGKSASTDDYWLVDLGHLAAILKEYYPDEAKAVADKLSETVTYSKANIENTNGLSLFYPDESSEEIRQSIQLYERQQLLPGYTKFLRDYVEKRGDGGGETWTDFDQSAVETVAADSGHKFTFRLTDAQMQNFSKAQFYIMKKYDSSDDHEEYVPIIDGECNAPSEDGLLSEDMPDKMLFFRCYNKDKEYVNNYYPVCLELISRNDNEQMYYAPAVLSVTNYSVDEYGFFSEYREGVRWRIKVSDGKAQMLDAVRTEDVIKNMAQKRLVDYTQFTNVSFLHSGVIPERNDDGTLKPYSEWSWGSAAMIDGDLSFGFGMEFREIPDPEKYVCMFEITDVNGNVYATEPVPYEN